MWDPARLSAQCLRDHYCREGMHSLAWARARWWLLADGRVRSWGASPDRLPAVLGSQLLASPSTQADWPVLVGEGAVQT